MQNTNIGNVSQLSSALRHVNINNNESAGNMNKNGSNEILFGGNDMINNNGDNDKNNIMQQQLNQQQSNQQNGTEQQQDQQLQQGHHTNAHQQVHLEDMLHPFTIQQQQQQQQAQQQAQNILGSEYNPAQHSRITQYFQNLPVEGYTLFSHRSAPNGYKVACALSELGLQYNTFFLDFATGEHRAPEFVSLNPNARVPALIDHSLENLGIWESGSIMLHLVNKYYKETGDPLLWSDNLAEQSQINSWIFFQTSGHAPMIGQALHFKYFHSQKIPSAIERYTDEVRRVYGVLEVALAERREALVMELDTENVASYSAGTTPISQSKFFDYPVWLVGENITIADLSFLPWNNVIDRIGINIRVEFPEVYKWTKHMMRRPAIIQALRGE
ncbi:hypothetical protein TPHA_0O01950 [Tetrapisispora phaffii CBS 4417]|uniref:Protein URE2 n=1 Tax=Tetrapisispora phaffii (strain ATCC 24235 / CBS 4417 / NBRC 1672 / NRRL Y-8282 / UCD 70-5) TaxID=1071381 RepID=G8C1Y3_TETPH|nr:hypothetical protein TPHA_0O01950 [Tetrapisispora phaffii CBS 4417]CCE66161.1 hypothetical protein TPHA_0O01950 [Tetrapisispora phaffii CBS 4417]